MNLTHDEKFESQDLFKIYKLMWDLKERLIAVETRVSLARCEENERDINAVKESISQNTVMIEKAKNAVTLSTISIIIGVVSSTAALIAAFKLFE
jgi:hypothetical protein